MIMSADAELPSTSAVARPLAIAVVLPQFHPIPENDAWWGKGFTEWRNVTKVQPQFPGHYQPHLPGELGFYDLRLAETRAAQADLAAEHGIGGFCYYHYWFHGQRLLNRPIDDIFESKEPNFPFCLCWANESWSRTWQSSERELLIEQRYSAEDDEAHIRFLLPLLRDKRYIRVAGKPLFIVYRADKLPDPQRTYALWRQIAQEEGVGELMLAQFEFGGHGSGTDPQLLGLDLSIEFSPDWRRLGGQYYATRKAKWALALGLLHKGYAKHRVFDYALMAQRALDKPSSAYPFLRCVSPGFYKSARRSESATIVVNSTPEHYASWLAATLKWTTEHNPPQNQIVFINAWNEWAEGNHLEPDARHGRAYLEATRTALEEAGWSLPK